MEKDGADQEGNRKPSDTPSEFGNTLLWFCPGWFLPVLPRLGVEVRGLGEVLLPE